MGIVSPPFKITPPFVRVNPTGDPRSEIWILGEAPGREEHDAQLQCQMGDRCRGKCKGHVFCGPSGYLLDTWLSRAGLAREDTYVTNTVAVWPGADDPDAPKSGSKKPSYAMVASERHFLAGQLEKYNPKYILALGHFAYSELFHGTEYAHLGMERINGRPCEVGGRIVFPLMHPAAGLHNPFNAVQTWLGLCSAAAFIHSGNPIPRPIKKNYRVLRGYEEVKAVLIAIPKAKRKIGIGVDLEGYPGDRWSLQFEVSPGVAYLIYASDKPGLRAFNRYAPRPFHLHNAPGDLDALEEMGVVCQDGDYEDTMVREYVIARAIATGDTDSDEASVRGQGLKPLSYKHLFEKMIEFKDIIKPHQDKVVVDYLDRVWGDMIGPEAPEVVNKWVVEPQDNDVSIMRGGPWGNPFPIIKGVKAKKATKKAKAVKAVKGRTRTQALREYKKWIVQQPELLARLPELIGKRLVCCCKPQKCHGDLLADLVAALPGKFYVPRIGRGQTIDKRILRIMGCDDPYKKWEAALRLAKPGKPARPDWPHKIVAAYDYSSRLTLSDIIPTKKDERRFVDYACEDADNTARLSLLQTKEMNKHNLWQPYLIDMGVIPMIRSMNKNGLILDRDRLREFERDVTVEKDKSKVVLMDLAAQYGMRQFNPDSNDDVAVLLYECMRAQHSGQKTPSGSRLSVEEKVLASLPLKGKAAIFRKVLLDYKEYQTLITRYINPMPGMVRADGKIHPEWRHTITVSGRLACGKKDVSPNFMAFPSRSDLGRRIRNCFVARPGYVYLSVDLSQIELRVLASLSGDPVMIRSFLEGRDMHDDAAMLAFGIKKPGPNATKQEQLLWKLKRTQAKELNFGAAYGLSAHGYQARLAMKGVDLDIDSCERALAAKHEEWEIAFEYLAAAGDELYNDPYAISRDMWGRIRYLPMIWSNKKQAANEARRQAGNMKIQGGAQGVEKMGMRAWWDQRDEMPNWSPLLQIHDDMVFEGPEEEAATMGPRIQRLFAEAAQDYFTVPITCGLAWGDSWGTMKEAA